MAGESEKDLPVDEKPDSPAAAVADSKSKKDLKKKKHGFISRIWRGLFGSDKDDFQSRLEKIAKEEAAILARVRKRALSSRRIKMNLIILTLFIEVFAVAYAIITASSVEDWKKRAFRVLPMFAWPGSMIAVYSAYVSCINIFERKDQKNLERLRTERQSKIDELKEKTNYYITQQLIQRYDTDPAAKAAAATVLASKLGADSGLKFNMGEDNKLHTATGKSNDVEFAQSSGLRNRRQPSQSSSTRSDTSPHHPETMALQQIEAEIAEHGQPVYVNHYEPGQGELNPASGGWLGRLTAMLVGDDPTQCYALICGNCHMHNGLATKEDYPHLTYICPHCRAVNGPKNKDTAHSSGSSTPNTIMSTLTDNGKSMSTNTGQSPREGPLDNVRENQEASPLATEESSSETMVASED